MSEYGRRIRAARGYAGKSQQDLADALGVDVQTVKRRESGSQQTKLGERIAIASICGVPQSFMELGFAEVPESEVARRLAAIEAQLEALTPSEPESPAEVLEGEADRLDEQRPSNGASSPRTPRRGTGT